MKKLLIPGKYREYIMDTGNFGGPLLGFPADRLYVDAINKRYLVETIFNSLDEKNVKREIMRTAPKKISLIIPMMKVFRDRIKTIPVITNMVNNFKQEAYDEDFETRNVPARLHILNQQCVKQIMVALIGAPELIDERMKYVGEFGEDESKKYNQYRYRDWQDGWQPEGLMFNNPYHNPVPLGTKDWSIGPEKPSFQPSVARVQNGALSDSCRDKSLTSIEYSSMAFTDDYGKEAGKRCVSDTGAPRESFYSTLPEKKYYF